MILNEGVKMGCKEESVKEFAQRWNEDGVDIEVVLFDVPKGSTIQMRAFVELGSIKDARRMLEDLYKEEITMEKSTVRVKGDFAKKETLVVEVQSDVLVFKNLDDSVTDEKLRKFLKPFQS